MGERKLCDVSILVTCSSWDPTVVVAGLHVSSYSYMYPGSFVLLLGKYWKSGINDPQLATHQTTEFSSFNLLNTYFKIFIFQNWGSNSETQAH